VSPARASLRVACLRALPMFLDERAWMSGLDVVGECRCPACLDVWASA
jgi:hypothetical protein